MQVLIWAAAVLGVLTLLFALDRLGLWMEDRGWIYYRRRKAQPGTFGNAMHELHSLLEPSRKHIVEVRKEVRMEQAEPGDPPEGGTNSRTVRTPPNKSK